MGHVCIMKGPGDVTWLFRNQKAQNSVYNNYKLCSSVLTSLHIKEGGIAITRLTFQMGKLRHGVFTWLTQGCTAGG